MVIHKAATHTSVSAPAPGAALDSTALLATLPLSPRSSLGSDSFTVPLIAYPGPERILAGFNVVVRYQYYFE